MLVMISNCPSVQSADALHLDAYQLQTALLCTTAAAACITLGIKKCMKRRSESITHANILGHEQFERECKEFEEQYKESQSLRGHLKQQIQQFGIRALIEPHIKSLLQSYYAAQPEVPALCHFLTPARMEEPHDSTRWKREKYEFVRTIGKFEACKLLPPSTRKTTVESYATQLAWRMKMFMDEFGSAKLLDYYEKIGLDFFTCVTIMINYHRTILYSDVARRDNYKLWLKKETDIVTREAFQSLGIDSRLKNCLFLEAC